jgi:hypothetical protein
MPDQVEISPDGRSSVYHYGQSTPPELDTQIDRAIERMANEPNPLGAAAQLFLRWAESSSEIRDLIPHVVEEYIRDRIAKRAKKGAKK